MSRNIRAASDSTSSSEPRTTETSVSSATRRGTPSQLEAFLERGYTFERLLADFGGLSAERSLVMEKIF